MRLLFKLIALFTFACKGADSTIPSDVTERATLLSTTSLVGPPNDQTSSLEVLGMTSNTSPQLLHTSETSIMPHYLSTTSAMPSAYHSLLWITMTTQAPPPLSIFRKSPSISSLETSERLALSRSPSTRPLLIPIAQTSIPTPHPTTDGSSSPATSTSFRLLTQAAFDFSLTMTTSSSSPLVKTIEVSIPSSWAIIPTLPNPAPHSISSQSSETPNISSVATVDASTLTTSPSSLKSLTAGATTTQASSPPGTNSVITTTPFISTSDTLPSPTANQSIILYPKVPEYLTAESSCSIIRTSCNGASFSWAIDDATTCFQCNAVQQSAAATLPIQSILSASYVQYLASFVSSVAVNNVPTSSVDVLLLSKISIWTVGLPSQSSVSSKPS